jgi:hypothetical protein
VGIVVPSPAPGWRSQSRSGILTPLMSWITSINHQPKAIIMRNKSKQNGTEKMKNKKYLQEFGRQEARPAQLHPPHSEADSLPESAA